MFIVNKSSTRKAIPTKTGPVVVKSGKHIEVKDEDVSDELKKDRLEFWKQVQVFFTKDMPQEKKEAKPDNAKKDG